MKTNAQQRERWAKFLGGGVMANLTPSEAHHLIADVNDAVGLFERVMSGSADGLLLGEIRDYLEEPKS